MFTGLIEQRGTIVKILSSRIVVRPERPFAAPAVGESIAVNGCCLTAEKFLPGGDVECYTLAETLRCTNLAETGVGGTVNLERALPAGGRLGGHLVQGHIDATARVLAFGPTPDGDIELRIELPPELAPEFVLKGSIAVDGVSLTVADLSANDFAVRLIPETLGNTALMRRTRGKRVNLETDIIGKYLRRQFQLAETGTPAAPRRTVSLNALREAGLL